MFNIDKNTFQELHNKNIIQEVLLNPKLHSYIESINKKADDYILSKPKKLKFSLLSEYYANGDRKLYEDVYFDIRGRLSTFALRVWLYKKQSDIKILEDLIWEICNEYSWSLPAHMDIDKPITIDLFASETGYALAEILFMLQDKISPLVAQRAISEVKRRLIQPFYQSKDKFPWEKMSNNWCAVCASSIGAATIYLEKNPEVIKNILARLQPTFNRFIDSFEDDGTCLEGLSYWTYGVSFYVSYADLLKRFTDNKQDILLTPKFKKIAIFQQKCYMGNNLTISISDGTVNDSYRLGLTSYLSNKFEEVKFPPKDSIANYSSDPCYRWCNSIKDLIWTNKYYTKSNSPSVDLKDQSIEYLPDAQWMICKNVGSYSLVSKGGHNDEPHNHNDIGSFILYKNGEILLTDLGAGLYTKNYFNDKRYTIFCNRSESHSVPIFDGKGQKAGIEYKTINTSFYYPGKMVMDIGKSYGSEKLVNLNRSFELDSKNGLTLDDTFIVNTYPLNATERFVTLFEPIIINNNVIIEGNKESVIIKNINNNLKPEISCFEHLTHTGKIQNVFTIDYPVLLLAKTSSLSFSFY